MKRYLVLVLFVVFLYGLSFSQTTIFVYKDFALVDSNLVQRTATSIIIPTTNMAIANSLNLSLKFSKYIFHKAESYSLAYFVKAYKGKYVNFEFTNGQVKKVKIISASPLILRDSGGFVYVSPAGEFLFPSTVKIDSRNYFLVFTSASTPVYYDYMSKGLGWKAIYSLNIDDSILQGKVEVWNKTDTTFKDFQLVLVAGHPFTKTESVPTYASLRLMNASNPKNVSPTSVQGYKFYDLGKVAFFANKSDMFLKMFEEKVKVQKVNAVYDPKENFSHALQVLRVEHTFPIPQGILNVYAGNGNVRYLGSADVPDCPASSTFEVPYGENFDLQVKSIKVSHLSISKNTFLDSYVVMVKNFSLKQEGIWVYVHVPQSSSVKGRTVDIERVSANEIRFYVKVSPKSEVDVGYSVQWNY